MTIIDALKVISLIVTLFGIAMDNWKVAVFGLLLSIF